MQTPECISLFQPTEPNVPQLDVQVDRDKGESAGGIADRSVRYAANLQDHLMLNDFNQFSRTWRVMAQADGPFRDSVEDVLICAPAITVKWCRSAVWLTSAPPAGQIR